MTIFKALPYLDRARIVRPRRPGMRVAPLLASLVVGVLTLAGAPAAAQAQTAGVGWAVNAHTYPTYLPPGARGLIDLEIQPLGAQNPSCTKEQFEAEKHLLTENRGTPLCPEDSPASASAITVTDTLPPGLTALEAGELGSPGTNGTILNLEHKYVQCSVGVVVTCKIDPNVGLPYHENLNLELGIVVSVQSGASGTVTNRATVAGGGAQAPAGTNEPITIGASLSEFGFADFDVVPSNPDGTIDTQAGSHPYAVTFHFDLNTKTTATGETQPIGEVKDVAVNLPPGFIGNPNATIQCTNAQLNALKCPVASQVGLTDSTISTNGFQAFYPLYNMVPPPGAPAEFAFDAFGFYPTYLVSRPHTGSDNALTTHADDITQGKLTRGNTVIIWGVPGDPRHDSERGTCYIANYDKPGHAGSQYDSCPVGEPETPLLTLPTQCQQPGETVPGFSIEASSWEGEGITAKASVPWQDAQGNPAPITGCESLHFEPSLTLAPDTAAADTPAGLTAEVTPPVAGLLEPEGLSPSDLQNTTVVLPAGISINPGQAAGLQACQRGDVPGGDDLPLPGENGNEERFEGPVQCPSASRVGTVSIATPLLADKLEGEVFILQSNPPHLELLVAASGDGVNLKLIGKVSLCEAPGEVLDGKTCEAPGQLITKFEGTPQLPFTDFKLSFNGGPQAALSTPTQCGTYTANADFAPWSSPFVADALENASFAIASGPGGAPCPSNPLPFSPSLTAGSTTDQAGGFTSFSLLLQAPDAQQRISKLQFKVPEGLSGMISKVPLCGEAQANAGTCSSASQIGHTVVASGPGQYPLVVPQPGQPPAAIYLTGPYQGAPFGLSIVVPVVAGPFVLETQVVRAKIEVDPHTAAITVTTNPLPQIIDGVPTDLRSIDAVIDREGFMFNPTNCTPQSFSGTATSAQGATAPISSPFGVGSCRSLEFKPKFAVSTPGRTTKAGGAGLTAKLTYPVAAQGTQSNITRVKVDLPKQLPSRLTTLQKACTNAQFELNPANCPEESKIGYATVNTPLLPVPVSGPAIFVSHGGEAFPSLTMVLQGDNVTIDLVGTTFISHAGITSTTFKTVPDVPFSSFELTLGQGKFSALAANLPAKDHGSFCGQKLAMPTEFLGQNGLKINESTPITVSGCAKPKALTRAQKLTAALKACHKKAKGKQAACEKAARKKYPPAKRKRGK